MKKGIQKGSVLKCENEKCLKNDNDKDGEKKIDSIVKPDIIFFGEPLPDKFIKNIAKDFQKCDLLIIMGTSLAVAPFCSLLNYVPSDCPRLLINRDKVGIFKYTIDDKNNKRDVFIESDCDAACLKLAKALKWDQDLDKLLK
jgi:NAD-dependent SIR2 family protein deacetylase